MHVVLTEHASPCHTESVSRQPRKDLGHFIVADAKICRGKPTFNGTRITVADVLGDVERGLSWEFICYRWGDGKITKEAIAEAVQLARKALLAPDGHLVDELDAA
jgi:uncharacterized protein (DUF433 family)